ncbi:MAG: alginate export family protein [Candidatus Omnitrophica bacterium]|nr:alginate export family protein [Candidatus Omnitrophota bacterium]
MKKAGNEGKEQRIRIININRCEPEHIDNFRSFTMKKGILMLAALGLVLGLAIPSYSAVQNVKVGGDFTIYGAFRHDFSFSKLYKNNDFLQSSVRVWVSSDLSNNVSTMVRIINERDWGQSITGFAPSSNGNITLDLAYVKLADLFTPGLNATIGRQDLKIGEGLVIGSQYNALNYGAVASLLAPDLGLQQSFDAIKLNYATPIIPLSAQGFFSKVQESSTAFLTSPAATPNDINLYGLSVLYAPSNWSLEPYIVNEYNYGNTTLGVVPASNSSITTAGLRGTLTVPAVQNLSFKAEYGKQFGKDETTAGHPSYEGWAGYVGGKYVFSTPMKPFISAKYSIYSGADAVGGKVKSWQPMFPSGLANNFGSIGYPAVWTLLYGGSSFGLGPTIYTAPYFPGVKVAKLGVGFQPLQRLGVYLNYFDLSLDTRLAATGFGAASSESVGSEVDLGLNYAYSDDVAFGVTIGQLYRGGFIKDYLGKGTTTEDPWQALASMTVSF